MILIGAQQTASEVERRVVANSAVRVVGRLDAAEAGRDQYGFLPAVAAPAGHDPQAGLDVRVPAPPAGARCCSSSRSRPGRPARRRPTSPAADRPLDRRTRRTGRPVRRPDMTAEPRLCDSTRAGTVTMRERASVVARPTGVGWHHCPGPAPSRSLTGWTASRCAFGLGPATGGAARVVAAVLAGIVGGTVLALAAGAQRTSSAPDRYTDAFGGDPELTLLQPFGPPVTSADPRAALGPRGPVDHVRLGLPGDRRGHRGRTQPVRRRRPGARWPRWWRVGSPIRRRRTS